nr:cytochrome c oxidase subunit 2 [Spirocerca lupi]
MYFQNWTFPLPGGSYSLCYHYVHSHYAHIMVFGFSVMFIFSVVTLLSGHTFKFSLKRGDSRVVEMILQILVINLLILMAGPGFWLIQYQGRMFRQSEMNLKVIGHQWYWSYEYGGSQELRFDSFLKSVEDLTPGEFRLFEVDNRCVLPVNVNIGIYCTSSDVIHSFAVPKCFIKMDALNGVLTKITYQFPIIGLFYGQCSEICGANHSFMPIVLEVVSLECWKGWSMKF